MFIKLSRIVLVPVIFAALIALSFPVVAAETGGYEVTPCQPPGESGNEDCMYAHVYDTDPAGTNVRSGPGTGYSIVTTLPSDRPVLVTITGSAGGWMRIKDPGICNRTDTTDRHLTGWIHGTRLTVTVVAPYQRPASLYAEPDTASTVVAKIPYDTDVTVAGCREGWMKVRYRGLEGWLPPESRGLIRPRGWCYPPVTAGETDVPLAAACYSDVYVAEPDPKGLAVRSGPSDEAPVVKRLPRHARVFITASLGEWMHINAIKTDEEYGDEVPGDPIGWTYGHLLAVKAWGIFGDYPTPWCDSSGDLLVFAEPITGSDVVTKIPRDTEVTIVGCWRQYLKVRYNGVEGWLKGYCGDPEGDACLGL